MIARPVPRLVLLASLFVIDGAAQVRAQPGDQPSNNLAAETPTVGATVSPTTAQIGDSLTLTVTAIGRRTTPTNLPAKLSLDPFEVVGGDPEIADKDLGDGKVSRTFRVQIAAYETGELTVPPIAVTYIGQEGKVRSQRTKPVPVKIESLLANESEPQLKETPTPE